MFQNLASNYWFTLDCLSDLAFVLDLAVQLRTGYLEQGLMVIKNGLSKHTYINVHCLFQVYDSKKLAGHYLQSRAFVLDLCALCPLDLLQLKLGPQPMLRFPRFLKVFLFIIIIKMLHITKLLNKFKYNSFVFLGLPSS